MQSIDYSILKLLIRGNYSLNIVFMQDEETFLADFKIAYELMMEKGSFTVSVPV